MRLTLLLFLTSCISFQLLGQQYPCGTVTPEGYLPPHIEKAAEFEEYKIQFLKDYELREGKGRASQRASGSCINSVPLSVWIVRTTAGTGGYTQVELDAALAIVNTRYASACLEFYTCEINYIDSDTYYDFDVSEEPALIAAHWTTDAMNAYFVNSVADGMDSYCGYARYPNVAAANIIMMDNSCANNGSTLAHEIGHAYSLPHTHNGGTELVDGSNCSTDGDRFCDTPADPNLSGNVDVSCMYTGVALDANGDSYSPDPNNIMSYSLKACRTSFSAEQLAAMNFTHFNAADRNDLACTAFEVDFTASSSALCDASDPVTFTNGSAGATTYDWDFDNDGTTDATGASPAAHVFGAVGTYDVALEISDGTNTIRRLKPGLVEVGGAAYPYSNNINSFTTTSTASGYPESWVPSPTGGTREYQWNIYNTATGSPGTGPDGGYVSSGVFGGTYLCVEASPPSGNFPIGQPATLITPCIDIPAVGVEANPALEFYYHMYGAGTGELHVDIEVAGVWTNDIMTALVGQQQTASSDDYLLKSIPLAAHANKTVRFRFRALAGTSFQGDIAVDEIALTASAPLPVQLMSFKGESFDNGSNQLVWNTASEENAHFFDLERSTDTRPFQVIATLDAKGATANETAYQYVDNTPQAGNNYYRLRMVDIDGSEEYSPIVAIQSLLNQERVELYPNPANTALNLVGLNAGDRVEISNQLGQLMQSRTIDEAERETVLSTINLQAGLFYVSVLDRTGAIRSIQKVRIAH